MSLNKDINFIYIFINYKKNRQTLVFKSDEKKNINLSLKKFL